MGSVERLGEVLAKPNPGLDELAAAIAAAICPETTEAAILNGLDELAAGVPANADADSVVRFVFGTEGFHGNATNYYAPGNSLLHEVLDRRTGNPLSLAVVTIEVARRRGVDLSPVGMPAHFLIGDGQSPNRWFDPFSGGRELSREDCEAIFTRFTGGSAEFSPVMLLPIPNESVASRIIANLRNAYVREGNIAPLLRVLELRTAFPAATAADKVELARMLGAMGRDDQAAEWYLKLAETEPELAQKFRAVAERHRHRRN